MWGVNWIGKVNMCCKVVSSNNISMIGKKDIRGAVKHPSIWSMSLAVALVVMVTLAAWPGASALAQVKAAPGTASPAKSAKDKQDADVYGKLASAWAMFYTGDKYEQTANQADALTKLTDARYKDVTIEASHLSARCWWAIGTKDSQAKATQIWKQLEKSTLNTNLIRLRIAKALAIEAQAVPADLSKPMDSSKLKSAIDALQSIMKEGWQNEAIAEAALDLGRLQASTKQYDEAKKTWEFVIAMMTDTKGLAKMELAPELAKVFADAAKTRIAHLRLDKSAGLAEYEAAANLLNQNKFAEALKAFRLVETNYPDTDSAARSEVAIGYCLVGLKQTSDAITCWKKFIESKPAGSWRGQALIAIMDTLLEDQLDLASASKFAEIAKASLPTGLADETAGQSWKDANYDIQLRVGMIAFCQNKGDVAAEAFGQARKLTDKKTVQDTLDSLIASASASKSVIPDDVKGSGVGEIKAAGAAALPTEKVALALSLGVINLCADRADRAQAFFDRVLGIDRNSVVAAANSAAKPPENHPMPGATPAQLAFATFGEGAILQVHYKPAEAKEQFQASMKAFPNGSWHDETLFRMAMIIMDDASAKYNPPADSAAGTKPATPAKPLDLDASAKAERDRFAALIKAKQPALDLFQELVKKYPKSSRAEFASYMSGLIQYDLAQAGLEASPNAAAAGGESGRTAGGESGAVSAAKSEQLFRAASATLAKFCEAYPKSLWAGHAYTCRIDIALERMFDLIASEQLSTLAIDWAKQAGSPDGLKAGQIEDVWRRVPALPPACDVGTGIYNCYLRAGMVAFLSEKYDQAAKFFEAGGAAKPTEGVQGNYTLRGMGLFVLEKASQQKMPVWDDEALKVATNDHQKLAIKLADTYLYAQRPSKSSDIYERFLAHDSALMPVPAALEAYCTMTLALAYGEGHTNIDKAMQLYQTFYQPQYADCLWTPDAILRLGVLTNNTTQDPKKAMPHYEYIFTKYPNHPAAERALYFYCLAAVQIGDKALAEKSINQFLSKYPKGDIGWRQHIQKVQTEELPKLEASSKTKGDKS